LVEDFVEQGAECLEGPKERNVLERLGFVRDERLDRRAPGFDPLSSHGYACCGVPLSRQLGLVHPAFAGITQDLIGVLLLTQKPMHRRSRPSFDTSGMRPIMFLFGR
jgi:hypothetical protein